MSGSYMGLTAQISSPGGHNAKVITTLLIGHLVANGATLTHKGGALVSLSDHWLCVETDGTIEVGAYEG